MTRRTRAPLDRPDPLVEAIAAYSAAFPQEGVPFLRGASGFETRRVAARVLRRAVIKGEPLEHWAVVDALGHERPPPDVSW